MKKNGKLIVIEGLDASGKATQTKLLLERLLEKSQQTCAITFPDYQSQSSALVRMYLGGELGDADDVNPYAASSFYAADRYISFQTKWKSLYQSGYTILADRYATSNAAHQMSKLPREEWDTFLAWMEEYEYGKLALPAPDAVVYLDMEPSVSRSLMEQRYAGDESKKDIHEKNCEYLNRCRTAALYAAQKQRWSIVRCDDGKRAYSPSFVLQHILAALHNHIC